MIIGIVINKNKTIDSDLIEEICSLIEYYGAKSKIDELENLEGSSLLVVLGGDGTILRASHYASWWDIPILGLNTGTIGFLTDCNVEHGISAIEAVLNNMNDGRPRQEYIEERMMLEVVDSKLPRYERVVLNDVCFGQSGKLERFELTISNRFVDAIRADALLVSTPTGSTAYNWSAGGPLLYPYDNMYVVTPICPQSVTRPTVMSGTHCVSIGASGELDIALDGKYKLKLNKGESLRVRAAKHRAKFVKSTPPNLYKILRKIKSI